MGLQLEGVVGAWHLGHGFVARGVGQMGRMVVASPYVRLIGLFFLPTLATHHEHAPDQV